jgi:hypothetical protein
MIFMATKDGQKNPGSVMDKNQDPGPLHCLPDLFIKIRDLHLIFTVVGFSV